MNTIKRGAFIVFEGLDKCGKSTISKCLLNSLTRKGYKCQLMNFPDRTTHTGHLIDEYLKNENYNLSNEAIHLLFSANRWENADKIKSLLHQGTTLIVDRYSYSGIAYSVAKKMDIDWCKRPENGLPKPDVVFLLHLDENELAKRLNVNHRSERYENIDMQTKVAATYNTLVDKSWIKIDAKNSIENLEELLTQTSVEIIEKLGHAPVEYINFK